MYRVNDKSSAIKEVQKYLYALEEEIYVAPSGVYDEATRAAVTSFQKKYGLTQSGSADKQTFDLLFNEYTQLKKKQQVQDGIGAQIDFPLTYMSQSSSLPEINRTISRISEYYGGDPIRNQGSFFSGETLEGVRFLREIYRLDGTDEIDEIFYFRMSEDLKWIDEINDTPYE